LSQNILKESLVTFILEFLIYTYIDGK